MLHLNKNLESLIDKLWNKFWSGGISNPLTAIEQITYLLFIKKLDDLDIKNIENAEFTGEKYDSIFEGTYTKLVKKIDKKTGKEKEEPEDFPKTEFKWSIFTHLSSEERLEHITQYVFPFIKEIGGENSHFTKYMKNAVFVIPSASLLHEAMYIIEDIFKEIEKDALENGQAHQDIQGDVYEMLLSEIASAGKNGQFRTPRQIINLLVDLVEPKYGNKITDPACGSAGFLLGAYQYITTSLDTEGKHHKVDENGFTRSSTSAILKEEVKKTLDTSLKGYDIDVTMVRLGLMNLMMHGITNPNIEYTDTLSKSFQKYEGELNSYDVVLANPPFTGNLNKGEMDDKLRLGTTKTELLFIDRIHTLLKVGGTAGIIIPQGVLFGSAKAFKEARALMIEESELKAVITMPSGVFKPYAGVATAILIFTKGGDTDEVFFYDMQSDGYDLDDKRKPRYKEDGTRDYGDLQDIIKKYKERASLKEQNDRKVKYFLVPKKEIKENGYDLSFGSYQEITYEEEVYDAPKDILDELISLEDEIQSELKDLKSLF
ncbi:N-6 DNA methylase [Arcobacter sp. LA11]|uniref:class I SAM-dependent DNA methyltransferase n=1 Tax=Arcobacter sp. LA11 TaxID=1898176 RepID=UPI0009321033|nr:N-6 DNA methylase [Arcobacter sp. LA11]